MLFAFSALLLGASASFQVAQAQLSVSSGCQSTFQNIVTSSNNQCLNAGALLSLATNPSNSSIVSTINNWLTGLCSQPLCSNSTIEAVVNSIASGCSDDLKTLGVNPGDLTSLLPTIDAAYPTVRQVVCLKEWVIVQYDASHQSLISLRSGSTLCPTQLLTNIQNALGTLSITNIPTIIQNLVPSGGIGNSTTASLLCSNCVKQSYNVVQKSYPGLISSSESSSITETCGSSFLDGQTPSGITESAVSGNGTTTNGASANTGSAIFPALLAAMFGIALMI